MTADEQVKRLRKLAGSAGGSTVFLMLYCMMGAYVFQQLEAPAEEAPKTRQQMTDEFLASLLATTGRVACPDPVSTPDTNINLDTNLLTVTNFGNSTNGTKVGVDTKTTLGVLSQLVTTGGPSQLVSDTKGNQVIPGCVNMQKLQQLALTHRTKNLVQVAKFGFLEGERVWTFVSSAYYCWSLATTTGYGTFAPVTLLGKIFTMIYSTVGTPLLVLNATKLGSLFTALLTRLKRKIVRSYFRFVNSRRKHRVLSGNSDVLDEHPRERLDRQVKELMQKKRRRPFRSNESMMQVWIAIIVFPLYVGFVGVLVYAIEPLSYFDSYYFAFETFTTIGFGDITPTREFEFMLLSIFMFIGIGLCASMAEFMEMQFTDLSKEMKTYVAEEFGEEGNKKKK